MAASIGSVRSRRGMSKKEWRNLRNGLLFVSPWIVGFLAFQLYPTLASLYYSFTTYSILDAGSWVGLTNYQTMFTQDPEFWTAVGNTLFYAAIAVPVGLVVSFTLALLLNVRLPEMAWYRTIYYLPTLVPAVAGSFLFLWLLNPEFGLINSLLRYVGIAGPGWLTDPAWSKPSLILMSFWGVGAATIIFLAGLGDIPQELHEAAMLDGATWLRRLRAIIVPMMTPTIFFNLIMGIIGSFQVFTQVYILGSGNSQTPGAPQDSLLFYQLYLFVTAFTNLKMGYASAMAWVLMLAILTVTLTVFKTQRRWVFYMGDTGEREG
jgi:multiple sugar transport system permease protein